MKLNSKLIKQKMKSGCITYRKLADEINMTESAIVYMLTKGTTKISTIDKLAKALKVKPKDLLI